MAKKKQKESKKSKAATKAMLSHLPEMERKFKKEWDKPQTKQHPKGHIRLL